MYTLYSGRYVKSVTQQKSDNKWLPILLCGYMKDIGKMLKSDDKTQFISTSIPISVIKICELYCAAKSFRVGDKMILQNGIKGIIRYIGIPEFSKHYSNQYAPMEIIGIETDKWYVNLGKGVIDDVRYFNADGGHAYFIQSVKIWKFYDMSSISPRSWLRSTWKCQSVRRGSDVKRKVSINDIKLNHRVKYKNGLIGDVLFMGSVVIGNGWNRKEMDNTICLKLIEFSPNAMSDGYSSGRWYIEQSETDREGEIYFVNAHGIVRNYGHKASAKCRKAMRNVI
eukprot:286616_1